MGSVVELFEEGSAMLEERYVNIYALLFPSSYVITLCLAIRLCSMFLVVMLLVKQK